MIPVDRAHLAELATRVRLPTYDPTAVRAGIVHLGVGRFHRAHRAIYVDALLNLGGADWGTHGIGVQPSNRTMRSASRTGSTHWSPGTTTAPGLRR